MKIINFEQAKIATYLQKGTGTPLVFVHGFCEDSSIWDDFITRFPDRYILRIDLPGFGNSEQIKDYSIPRFAALIHHVLDNFKIESFIFIGHSMGGYVGLEFAKKYAALLKGLCLFHSHPFKDTEAKQSNRNKSIDFIKTNGSIYYVKQLIPALFAAKYRNNNHLPLAKLMFKASKYSAENLIAGLEAMLSRVDNTQVLKDIDVPTLFIIGDADTIVPDYLGETALPNISSIHLLKDVGHMGMLESPKQCEKIIKNFIELTEIV